MHNSGCAWPDCRYDAARGATMALDTDKIDDAALALLYLTLHNGYRA
jgi:hypothetical protein